MHLEHLPASFGDVPIKVLLEGRERAEYFDQYIAKGSGGFKKAKKEASSLKTLKLPFLSAGGESVAAEDE